MSRKSLITRLLFALLITGSVAFMIYYWFFTFRARVPSGGMMNTIIPGDHVLIQKSFGQIERGSIVLFRYPTSTEFMDKSEYFICRVVGLPGETIEMRGNTIYINGRPLDELKVIAREDSEELNPLIESSTEGTGPYRVFYTDHPKNPYAEVRGEFATKSPFQIPSDHFFLMGDNRDNSEDSRYRGPVPRELIWGEASLIYYSEGEHPGGNIRMERLFKRVR